MAEKIQNKKRIYKYDNVKAVLIFLVVVGHMTSDYVSDSHMVRWVTLWIYTFHMPAFIFLSGLVHKQYITEERASLGERGETRMRWDKVLGFFFCGYTLKVFLQISRTWMGQHPVWSWTKEPGIPWYLFVMAEFELVFFLMRHIDGRIKPKYVILGLFVLSAVIGYIPSVGDTFCLARMINFLPIYSLGYYSDMRVFLEWIEKKRYKVWGWIIITVSLVSCYLAPWSAYGLRRCFTGRRSYEYFSYYIGDYAIQFGWGIRLLTWAFAILLSLAVIAVIPDKDMGFVTTIGARTLNVYFWHRSICYLFRNWMVLPKLFVLFGGTYDKSLAGIVSGLAFRGGAWPMLAALVVYLLIAAIMTAVLSLKPFEHPCADIMNACNRCFSNRIRK